MTNPKWRMSRYTHEIVAPGGEVVARLRITQTGQMALDTGDSEKIRYSGGGNAFGYHVTYNVRGRAIFPTEAVACELRYFSGLDFPGHMVRAAA